MSEYSDGLRALMSFSRLTKNGTVKMSAHSRRKFGKIRPYLCLLWADILAVPFLLRRMKGISARRPSEYSDNYSEGAGKGRRERVIG